MSSSDASPTTSHRPDLRRKIEKAQALKIKGNEHFKASEYSQAASSYYEILLTLRGLDGSMRPAQSFGLEETDGDKETALEEQEQLSMELRALLLNTYTNLAAMQIKTEKWAKALASSQEALRIDPNHRKAKFREAQARIGLGETAQAVRSPFYSLYTSTQYAKRRILQDLESVESDASIKAALKAMDAAEKAREKKNKDLFNGFLNKRPLSEKTPQANGDSIKVVPKIQEIVEDDDPTPKVSEIKG